MKKLGLFLILFLSFPFTTKALVVSESNVLINKGGSKEVELYVNTEEEISTLDFDFTYSSYDVPASLVINSDIKNTISGIHYKLSFSNPISGNVKIGTIYIKALENPNGTSGNINMTSVKGTSNGSIVRLNPQSITVNITDEVITETIDSNIETPLLKSIESNIVSIKLKENVYDYEITIKEGIKELDLNPITKDPNSIVTIETQKINELTNNTIVIKVTNGDISEEYKIKVNVKETKTITTKEDRVEESKPFKYKFKWVVLIIVLSLLLIFGIRLDFIIKNINNYISFKK